MPAEAGPSGTPPDTGRPRNPAEAGRPHALRSGAFRFALALALIFAAGSAALLWAVERQVGGFAGQTTEAMLRSESAILAGEYRQYGLPALLGALERHTRADAEAPYRYLLIDARGHRLFGDLPAGAAGTGWGVVGDREGGGGQAAMRSYGTPLGGLTLVVATDAFDIATLRDRLAAFTIWSGIAITAFALVGGYFAGRIFLRRLDRINHAVARIIDGEGASASGQSDGPDGGALPAIGVGPEFDQLTANLNRMLDRKAAAMDALRQVSTAIAHDLRTPLTRLQQRLETLRETAEPDPAGVEDAIHQIDGILATFQALLRIGMLEGGAGRQRFTRVDLSAVAERVHQAYEPVAEDADHLLEAALEPGIAVAGDAELLAQLLTNLIENAIVHTPAGTRIRLALAERGGTAILRVGDDGPGVPPADREKIFRRFYRADRSRSTPGAGLGLSLVAAIADLHSARCAVVPDGRGLTIELRLARVA